MNAAAYPAPAAAPRAASVRALLAELRRREPRLARYGLACLTLAGAAFAAAAVDPRQLGGVPVWLKPAKFFLSVGVFALSWAWFAGLVRPERRRAPALRVARWTLLGASTFELFYITLQAARGEASHFNTADPLHALLYTLMGVGAVLLIATTLPLAWEVARRPAPGADPAYRRAVVLGLVLTFVLGGLLGGYMGAQTGHAVGAEAGHLAVAGWNRAGGDLRVAHFLGLHAEQGLPLLTALAGAAGVRRRGALVWLLAALWTAATLGAFAQALAGRAFPLG